MNWEQVEGNWKKVKGSLRAKWGKLTDDDLDQAKSRRDQLAGRLQERYGIAKDKVEKELDELIGRL